MFTSIADDLEARRQGIIAEARTIAELGVAERRDLTASEQSEFDAKLAEANTIQERITAIRAGERAAHDLEDSFYRHTGRRPTGSRSDGVAAKEIRDLALGNRLEPVTIMPDSDAERTMRPAEDRALSIGGGATTGGATVPRTLYGQIIVGMTEGSGLLAAGATVLSTDTGEDLVVPVETSAPVAVNVAESAPIGGTDPVFGSKTLKAYKYGVLVKVSRELLEDNATDLESYLATRCGFAIGAAFGPQAIKGTGVAQPTGILSQGITAGVTAPTGVTTTFGNQATAGQGTDLLEMLRASVAEPYADTPTSGFLMRNATRSLARRIKSTTGDLIGTEWANGERITLDAFVDDMGVTKKPVLFGDWSKVWIRMAGGLRFERSNDYSFNTDEVTFRCVARMDIAVVDPNAIRYLVTAAS